MKKILLFLMLLLLTGCSAKVELKLDKDKIIETTKIYDMKVNVYDGNSIKQEISLYLADFERDYEFYTITEYEENEYVGKNYDITIPLENWSGTSILNPCYEVFDFKKTDTNISLNTSEENLCVDFFEVKDVTLTLESDLKLISTNADRIDGNKLVWNINSTNYKNKSISFDYQLIDSKDSASDKYLLYAILIIVVGLVVGLLVFIRKRNGECNKI